MARFSKYFDIHKPVFIPAAIIIISIIIAAFFLSSNLNAFFNDFQNYTAAYFGWFFIILMNIFVVAALFFAFSDFGKVRLGGPKAKPEFSTFAWFSMLFSAGLGIGLMFYGVAEPMTHFTSPPLETASYHERASQAMLFTFLHYGLHGWAPYVIVGLALAFFTFNKNLPLTISSLFYPILKERIYQWPGHVIDIIAVISTLFGLATTLGLGVQQVAAGMDYIFQIPNNKNTHVWLILIITLAATTSVVLGLDKGVRFLSVLNMRLALLFLFIMLLLGPTSHLLDSFIQNTGNYFNQLISVGTWSESFSDNNWQHDWTVFYWAWWISWSPFVGMFIARVSKGRTIKEFVLGVLLVPSLLVFFWMSVFGGLAIHVDTLNDGQIGIAVAKDLSTALFVLLDYFPFSSLTSLLGIFLVTVFFVTSSDSGSLVIDSITSGGKLDAPVGQRIFWALCEGGVAASLLYAGGLKALQSAVTSIGLPFGFLLLFVVYALYKELKENWTRDKLKATKKEKQEYINSIKKLLDDGEPDK